MHIASSDTWMLGVSWLDKRIYGEGGLQIHVGKRIVCLWDDAKECYYCLGQGEHWPLNQTVWRCTRCDAEYRD